MVNPIPFIVFWALLTVVCVYAVSHLINLIKDEQERLKMTIQALIMLGTISTAMLIFYSQKIF